MREHGLAGLSLRDLARKIGMQAPSLYSYFGSKHDIYDAMFCEGWQAYLERIRATGEPRAVREAFRTAARTFVDFALEDPARYQLLCQRTIPGFEPSPESYAVAVEALEMARARFARHGITDPALVDLWTAMTSGLVDQQIANDPGGRRWYRLIDDVVDMFLAHVKRRRR